MCRVLWSCLCVTLTTSTVRFQQRQKGFKGSNVTLTLSGMSTGTLSGWPFVGGVTWRVLMVKVFLAAS
jgi:hypothetical protein